ncbi:GDSL esterase/lipase, partial [Trifolium medium]|nr:GDSL esterase/lipase [Trifolium medium]
RLYDSGARNFWIHNTGPLGCLAQNVATFGADTSKLDELGCLRGHNQAAKAFNLHLQAFCSKLKGQYLDVNVIYVDIFTIKSNLIANYSKHGYAAATSVIFKPIIAVQGLNNLLWLAVDMEVHH